MAVSAKDSKLLEQKDLIGQLNTTIAAQTELIQSLKKDYEADREQIQNLLAQVDYLTKKLFGTSSEKMKDVEGQLNLFDEAEQEADVDLKAPVIKVPEHTRKKKRTLEELFKGVPSRDEIISLPEGERVCDECGAALEPIGKEFVRHEFRFTPAKGEVVNIYRETYKCPVCSTADAMEETINFVKAAVPEAFIPNSYASGSAVAWVMYQKFANAMPLYRQEQDWHQLGVDFTRATLANWIIYCADNYFKPMYDYFHRQLLLRKYLMADETRIQVLNEPERNPETDSFMWLFRSGEDGLPPIVLYNYTETRARYNAVDFLDGLMVFRTDTWKRMVIRVIIISLVSGAAPAGRIQEDTSLMRFQKESSMITAIRQYRESSSVQSFLSMSADHRTRSTHLSREKPIVLKKKNRYSMRSGAGLTSRSHVREAVSRQR